MKNIEQKLQNQEVKTVKVKGIKELMIYASQNRLTNVCKDEKEVGFVERVNNKYNYITVANLENEKRITIDSSIFKRFNVYFIYWYKNNLILLDSKNK